MVVLCSFCSPCSGLFGFNSSTELLFLWFLEKVGVDFVFCHVCALHDRFVDRLRSSYLSCYPEEVFVMIQRDIKSKYLFFEVVYPVAVLLHFVVFKLVAPYRFRYRCFRGLFPDQITL